MIAMVAGGHGEINTNRYIELNCTGYYLFNPLKLMSFT